MLESYGLTKEAYRRLIENSNDKSSDIARKVKIPKRVYRFRRFGTERDSTWKESNHWHEDVNGICLFSTPDSFNKNDDNDCKVYFDIETVFDYMFVRVSEPLNMHVNDNRIKILKESMKPEITKYKESLQQKMRVGCFTVSGPSDTEMWNDPSFGDRGRGFCIEYRIDNENFMPDGLAFLPVLYDDVPYDNTEAMKAIIDSKCNNNNGIAIDKAVCLGYGHTLIKPIRYEKECEWRLVIPVRDDGAHKDFFNIDRESKRDMSSVMTAIYMGPNIAELSEYKKYRTAILEAGRRLNIPIYQMTKEKNMLINNLLK